MIIWGWSGMSHDASLAVFEAMNTASSNKPDLKLLFAAHSERYSRIKNDKNLHHDLISEALSYGKPAQIYYYEKPLLKKIRQVYSKQYKLLLKDSPTTYMRKFFPDAPRSTSTSHHLSHAAAGYYTSEYDRATVMVIDSIGEWETISIWDAADNKLKRLWHQTYPDSIGLWYSAMTQRIGLKPQEDEYILMGMAAYGDPYRLFYDILNDFFYPVENNVFQQVFYPEPRIKLRQNLHRGCSWWRRDLNLVQDYLDIAAATQAVYEYLLKIISNWARWHSPSGNLVFMGGCALNCAANNLLIKDWNDIWIMPNPGDSGSTIGAVLANYHQHIDWPGPYLGHNIEGEYPIDQILHELKTTGICGVASGRAEFGPRALGHRSLLADPRGAETKQRVNAIKHRQQFRPFAPAILAEYAGDYFEGSTGPYMQFTARCKFPELYPAIVHADGTSRVQTVSHEDCTGFRQLLEKWHEETGCPMLLNTSLNIRGEPLVNSRNDAERWTDKYGVKVCLPD